MVIQGSNLRLRLKGLKSSIGTNVSSLIEFLQVNTTIES